MVTDLLIPLAKSWRWIYFWISEPGYYEQGNFGIRIEDIVQIVPAQIQNDFNGRGALTFRSITMCPIQTKLVNKQLLDEDQVNSFFTTFYTNNNLEHLHLQINYLNKYHATVRATLQPLLEKEGDEFTIRWLKKETEAI